MSVALIWAEAQGGVIGRGGGIPWHLPEDLARFRRLTEGGTVVMGRRTWESLPDRFRPLPGRRNVVVTRQTEWEPTGAETAHSVEEALRVSPTGTVWVMGGGELYRAALPVADRLEITYVDLAVEGDTTAPAVGDGWQRTREPVSGWLESRTGLRYRFETLTRAGTTETI